MREPREAGPAVPGGDALHRSHRPGGGHGPVPQRGLRGRGTAGRGRLLRRRAPRLRLPSRRPAVPPHRQGTGAAGRCGGPFRQRVAPRLPRLRPLAADPAGAPGRRGRRLPPGRRPLRRGPSPPAALVPRGAPGRRRRASRRAHPGHRAAGPHLRPLPLRHPHVEAAEHAPARSGAGPDARRRAPPPLPKVAGRLPRPGVPGPGARRGGGGPGRSRVESPGREHCRHLTPGPGRAGPRRRPSR